MNKRAITEHGILTVIFGIIVVIAIAVTAPVIYRVLTGSGGSEGTAVASLHSLRQTILDLIVGQDHKDKKFAWKEIPLFIEANKFIFVGFAAEDQGEQAAWSWCDGITGGESIKRPVACPANNTCLCAYKDDVNSDFNSDIGGGDPPVECATLPKEVVFLAPAKGEHEGVQAMDEGGDDEEGWNWGGVSGSMSVRRVNDAGGGPMGVFLRNKGQFYTYENVVLYGECSDMPVWNSQSVYVEKFSSGGKHYIYIAHLPSSKVDRRKGILGAVEDVNVPAITQKLGKGKASGDAATLGLALRHAYDLEYANVGTTKELAEAYVLLAQVWESVAELPAEKIPDVWIQLAGLGYQSKRDVWLAYINQKNPALTLNQAAKFMAYRTYYQVLVSFYKPDAIQKSIAEIPQIPLAALRYYQLSVELLGQNDPNTLGAKATFDEIRAQKIPEIEIALIRDDRKRFVAEHKQGVTPEAKALRDAIDQFLVQYGSQPEYQKELLHIRAESYLQPSDPKSMEEAFTLYIKILNEYPRDHAVAGAKDPKEMLLTHCFTGNYPALESQCAAVVPQPPKLDPAALAQLEDRKTTFVAVKEFADRVVSEGYPSFATAAYNNLIKAYTAETGALKYAEQDDYNILIQSYFALARLALQGNEPYAADVWLGFAGQYLGKVSEQEMKQSLSESYTDLFNAAQECKALRAQVFPQNCRVPS